MIHVFAAVAVALVELVPIAQPKGVPAPSFEVGGYRDGGAPTRAPLLVPGKGGHHHVRVSFTAPLEGECGVAQVVEMNREAMMTLLTVLPVHRDELKFAEVELGNAADLAEAGATSSAPTIVVVCFIRESPSATQYSRIFRSFTKLPEP